MNELAPRIDNAPLPSSYEAARQALAQCERLDECKDWSDRAAALASYARQSKDESLLQTAVRIQLRALERVGELLKEYDARGGDRTGKSGGAPTFAVSQREAAEAVGLSKDQQMQAVRIANVPPEVRNDLIESERPPTATELANLGKKSRQPMPDYLGGRTPETFNRILHFVAAFEGVLKLTADYAVDLDATLPEMTPDERARLRAALDEIALFIGKVRDHG